MTFLVNDGVVPSNEERGYVLRRIIRRAVRHAYRLGAENAVTPALVDATVEAMGEAYPDLVKHHDVIVNVITREEERFRQTLQRGLDLLDGLLEDGDVSGEQAFFLHDTLGFPVDLTREIAEERGRRVDYDGFRARMEEQRTAPARRSRPTGERSRRPSSCTASSSTISARPSSPAATSTRRRTPKCSPSWAAVSGSPKRGRARRSTSSSTARRSTPSPAVRWATPERSPPATAARSCACSTRSTAFPARSCCTGRKSCAGELAEGDSVTAAIDAERRDRIRRNHTATHILHWALREVLGPHVKQAGSLVAPDRLRFDFSHFQAVTPEELDRIEALANREIITDAPVRHYETTREHAEAIGAIAFFGEKYGDLVRVLEAGDHSVELCGGTHVHALGFIGPIKIVNEQSIGANLRRIEAVTGDVAIDRIHDEERQLRRAAETLKVAPAELPDRIEQLQQQLKALRDEAEAARAREAVVEATALAASASDGVVAARRDGLDPGELRRLALATRDAVGSGIVALVGLAPDRKKAGIAVAVTKELVDRGVSAADLAAKAAKALGGGTAKNADVVSGGGPNVGEVDEALSLVRRQATEAVASASRLTAERERMGRVLGVDLGSRRIGLALSDPAGRVATPHGMIERSGDPPSTVGRSSPRRAKLTPPASWSGSRCRSPATPALPRGRSSRRSTPSARWRAKKSRWRPTMKGSRR